MHPDLPSTARPPRLPRRHPLRLRLRTSLATLALALVALAGAVPATHAQDPGSQDPGSQTTDPPDAAACDEPGKNRQCTEFGSLAMDTQRDIRGQPIDLAATFTLATTYPEQGGRWLLVSVRSAEEDGSDPVTIDLVRFASGGSTIPAARIEQPDPSELNVWVETLDVPVGTPVDLDLRVGATERGAFQLETLVMAFDRGYAPMLDADGNEASLFSFTLLGVNDATAGGGDGSLLRNMTPGLESIAAPGALLAVALVLRRRAA